MTANKKVMAKNILDQMLLKGVNATDVCKALGIKQNTFSDWVNGKTYPRIDKIELMANYFGISKAMLVESADDYNFVCTDEEKDIIRCYRKANDVTKDNICAILGLKRANIGSNSLEVG